MAQEIGKLFRVKKQVQGVVPSTQNSEYYELINLGGSGNVDQSAVVNTYKEETQFKTGDILLVEEEIDDSLFFDINYPVPPYYIQFANLDGTFIDSEEPTNWYKKMYGIDTTWELLFNTESVYFRTEGDLANNGRSNGLQGDAGRNATGKIGHIGIGYTHYGEGVHTINNEVNGSGYAKDGSGQRGGYFDTDLSRQWTTANEFRTTNRLIRVYHLVSINGVNVSDIIGE